MIECIFQDGHPIDDITWMRYRKKESALKVRHANEDDTGVYTCKGINGFGSAEARIEVIVVGEFRVRKLLYELCEICVYRVRK